MSKVQIQNFIVNHIKKQNSSFDPANLNINYIQNGLIDSLGIIELIEEIESHFSISFATEELQNSEFQNINGLIDIISLKVAAQ